MPSPNLVTASQSERTEAQQRARVTWEQLQMHCVAMMAAKKAFVDYATRDNIVANASRDVENQIKFDLGKNAAEQLYIRANTAYQSALKRYQEQQS